MEADWSVELGADDPVIVTPWAADHLQYVDLRRYPAEDPRGLDAIAEAREHPHLRTALVALNAPGSPVFTAKCDAWQSGPDDLDPFEMDTDADEALCSAGCYIDLVRRDAESFASFAGHEQWLGALVAGLRSGRLRGARMDFVLRAAQVDGKPGFGVTWFVLGCGATPEQATARCAAALHAGLAALLEPAPTTEKALPQQLQ